jgi:hypothetical protein
MLSNEKKQQIFQKLRTENYQASMRLEGFTQRPTGSDKSIATGAAQTLKTNNVR